MKLQTILERKIKNSACTLVLAWTDRREFVTTFFNSETSGYSGGHYFQILRPALEDFEERTTDFDSENESLTYCARQIGQLDCVWEDLEAFADKADPGLVEARRCLERANHLLRSAVNCEALFPKETTITKIRKGLWMLSELADLLAESEGNEG